MSHRRWRIASLYGLPAYVEPGFFVGTVGLIVIFTVLGAAVLGHTVGASLVGAIVTTALMWLSEVVHQIGHAIAAGVTGHRMSGFSLGRFLVLGTSIYPADEPTLPPSVHIRRALGGPIGSLVVSLVTGLAALALRGVGGLPFEIAAFLFVLNFFAYTLQVLFPFRFNDGSVVWDFLRHR